MSQLSSLTGIGISRHKVSVAVAFAVVIFDVSSRVMVAPSRK